MAIVTLISDWGTSDYYLPALKAKILASAPENTAFIDINHNVKDFFNHKKQAVYLLNNVYKDCPNGSVHLICLENLKWKRYLLISFQNQYFLSSDSGIPGLLFQNKEVEVVEIAEKFMVQNTMFPEKDIFAPIVSQLLNDAKPNKFGKKAVIQNTFSENPILVENIMYENRPAKQLRVPVLYIDGFQNVHLNINKEDFNREKGKFIRYRIEYQRWVINRILNSFYEVGDSDGMALWGDDNLLMIAQRNGTIASMWGFNMKSQIKIIFY
jgi:S-adenosylmethionine hydrolase